MRWSLKTAEEPFQQDSAPHQLEMMAEPFYKAMDPLLKVPSDTPTSSNLDTSEYI